MSLFIAPHNRVKTYLLLRFIFSFFIFLFIIDLEVS